MPAVAGFTPSTRAPLFRNGPWPPGSSLTISVHGLPSVSVDVTPMGLCGGMSFLARDIHESGAPQLRSRDASRLPSQTVQHILGRLLASFHGPQVVARWLAATQALDHDTVFRGGGLFRQTVAECPAIMADIDAGTLCPIGLVLAESWAPWDVFLNHVVLAWAYERNGDQLTLWTYDCNRPGRDDITIQLDIGTPAPAKPIATNGTDGPTSGHIRGFFRLPYAHADPSPAYVDDAAVTIDVPPAPAMTPRSTASVRVTARNAGTTTWTAADGYRLGSQRPQDATTWGIHRVELSSSRVDPDETAVFQFDATTPAAAGRYDFAWMMVRELVRWFGNVSPALQIAVGIDSPLCDQLHEQHLSLRAELHEVELEMQGVDWSDPFLARHEAVLLGRRARGLQQQLTTLERQQSANGCRPG